MPSSRRALLPRALLCASLLLSLCAALPPSPSAASPPLWPPLDAAPSSPADSRGDAAVIIGVEDYVFIPDVPGALQNALDWWRYLQARGVPLAHATLLRNADATAEAITDALAQAKAQVQPGAKLWVVFIGHGVPSPDGTDGLLVGVDAQQTARSVQARSVSRRQLLDLASGPDHDAVLVLDACFSGRDRAGDALVPGLQPLVLVQAADPTSRRALVFSAAAGDEFAGALPLWPRPAFSYLLLGALRGWGDANGDGAVTADEALGYTRGALQAMLRDRRQTPELWGQAKATPLSTDATEPGPDLSAVIAALYPPPPMPDPILPPPTLTPTRGVSASPSSPTNPLDLYSSRVFIGAGFPSDISYINGDLNPYTTDTPQLQRRLSTGDTSLSSPSSLTFSQSGGPSTNTALVAGADIAISLNDVGFVMGAEVGWTEINAPASLSSDASTGSGDTAYTAYEPISATLSDLVWLDVTAELQYRYPFGASDLGMYIQGGVGARLSWLSLAPPTDPADGAAYLAQPITLTTTTIAVPFRLGMDYAIAGDLSLDLRYSLFSLSSSVMHTLQLGFGLPF